MPEGYTLPDSPGGQETGPKPNSDKSFLNSVGNTISNLKNKFTGVGLDVSGVALNVTGDPWPQTQTVSDFKNSEVLRELYPGWKSKGFLPPVLCVPRSKELKSESDKRKTKLVVKKKDGYIYQDWRGQIIEKKTGFPNAAQNFKSRDTSERFNLSLAGDLPRKNNQNLIDNPYSTRDLLSIFGDYSTDYFKHGLQIVDGIGTLPPSMEDFYKAGQSADYRKTNFKYTPFENSDPVIFGFEIIFDDVSSPLLNGSVLDFLNLIGNVSEINARKRVYEEFKYHFTKFFKTKATVRYDESQLSITKTRNFGFPDTEKNQKISEAGKKAYKSYYVQKIAGLAKLIENNTPVDKNYIVDYNKDIITLDFHESVSLSVGTLAHLYKLLYWSKPNGKGMVPENLLRFNCDIIISEMRNFARIRKSGNNLEVIKDNLSRYIYSLRECQFYFDKMPHEDALDLSQPKNFEHVQVQFDYKYSTMKFERFVPDGDTGQGKYVGYDMGALWKVGNPGERDNRKLENGGSVNDSSIPKFYTEKQNRYNQNGVTEPIVLSIPSGRVTGEKVESTPTDDKINEQEDKKETTEEENSTGFQKFKETSKKLAKEGADRALDAGKAALKSELGRIKGKVRRSLRGLLNKVTGINGISPPRNVYTGSITGNPTANRVFYDIRGELLSFAGDALGDLIKGQK
jgi:hypothetical protein